MVHRGASASRRLKHGMSDFGGQPPHSKVVEVELSVPRNLLGFPKDTLLCTCVHPSYYETGGWILNGGPVCHSGCTEVVLQPVSCQRRTLNPLGAYIKLRKIADKYKRREKILALLSWFQDSIRSCKKIFWCRNVKNSALFSGHTWTSPDIAGHRRIIGI